MSFFSFISKSVSKFNSKSKNNRDCDDRNDGKYHDHDGDNRDGDKHNDCRDEKDDCGCDDNFVIDRNTVIIKGTSGNDRLIASEGEQTVYGLGGNDNIAGRAGDDQLSGGDGNDTIAGDIGDDIICGGAGDDYLLGNRSNDDLSGGKGNDQLYGGENDDVLRGGDGNDFVSGDEGDDALYGNKGADVFAYGKLNGTLAFGDDVIKDFEFDGRGREGDTIKIVNLGTAFDTYAEVMSVAQQTADGVLFDFGNNRSLLVEDVRISELTSDYFVF